MFGNTEAFTIPPNELNFAGVPSIILALVRNQKQRPSGIVSLPNVFSRGPVGHLNPRSTTVTVWPACARRSAPTAPPNPDPITRFGV